MKHLLAMLLLLAAPTAAAELAGATTAAVGETIWIAVEGEPAFDATLSVGDNLETFRQWLGTTRFQVSAPDDANPTLEPDVQIKFSFTSAGLEWDLRAKFVADKPGVYVIAALIGQELALHRVQAGPVVPPPLPDDPPGPSPTTTGPAFVIVFARNQELTSDQSGVLLKFRVWSDSNPSKSTHLVLSPDHATSDSRVKQYLALVPDPNQLPWCIITRARTDQAGAAVLWSGPLPATADELISRVEAIVK